MTRSSSPLERGLQLVPTMSAAAAVSIVVEAEELGYDYCLIADEGLMHDVYGLLAAAALATTRIRLGAVTNPYTRHPAATAAALATLDEISSGRALVNLVAGGSMVLNPMGIARSRPVAVMEDTISILRALWSGDEISFEGNHYSLDHARLATAPCDIPIWVAARGPRMLALAGEMADGVVLMVRSDLGDALEIVSAAGDPTRIYLDRLAYTPETIEEARSLYAWALADTPPRVMANLGVDPGVAQLASDALTNGTPEAIADLVTTEMLGAYQIAGTRQECSDQLREAIDEHGLDVFLVNVTDGDGPSNRQMLLDVIDMAGPR